MHLNCHNEIGALIALVPMIPLVSAWLVAYVSVRTNKFDS